MTQPNEEVKEFVERVELPPDDSEDSETVTDDEADTSSSSSEEEQPTESSDDEESEKPDELVGRSLTPEEPEKPVVEDELKSVDGETPSERAKRLEIKRLRKTIRELKGNQLFEGSSTTTQVTVAPDASLIDPQIIEELGGEEEVAKFERIMGTLGKRLGFVRKDELHADTYNGQAKTVLDTWLGEHPEYSAKNDPEDVLWGRFIEEFNSGLYNKTPPNPKDLARTFDKIHDDIFGIQKSVNRKAIDAQKSKLKMASHSTASPGSSKSPGKSVASLDPDLRSKLQGFTPEEIDELFGD